MDKQPTYQNTMHDVISFEAMKNLLLTSEVKP